jgi:hypothetical protein
MSTAVDVDDELSVYDHGVQLSPPDLCALLAATEPSTVDDYDAVEYLRLSARKQNQDTADFYARVYDVVHRDRYGGRRLNEYADKELAAALRISNVAAGKKLRTAITIIETYPLLWRAMREGRLDELRAIIFDQGLSAVSEEAGLRIVLKLCPRPRT